MSGPQKIREYPEIGSPDRFDAIVNRGAGMRRRRRMLGASGAGVAGVACLALFLALNGGTAPSSKQSITADNDTITNPTPTEPSEPEFVSVNQNNGKLTIEINDPEMAFPTDPLAVADSSYATQQCVTVSIADSDSQPVAGAHACMDLGNDNTAVEGSSESSAESTTKPATSQDFELALSDGVEIMCAASEERFSGPVEFSTRAASSRFVTQLTDQLEPGTYSAEIIAVSGFGDGCPAGNSDHNTESAQAEKSIVVRRVITVG